MKFKFILLAIALRLSAQPGGGGSIPTPCALTVTSIVAGQFAFQCIPQTAATLPSFTAAPVSTLLPGAQAQANITPNAAGNGWILNLAIPQGFSGPPGIPGPQGPQGPPGTPGSASQLPTVNCQSLVTSTNTLALAVLIPGTNPPQCIAVKVVQFGLTTASVDPAAWFIAPFGPKNLFLPSSFKNLSYLQPRKVNLTTKFTPMPKPGVLIPLSLVSQ